MKLSLYLISVIFLYLPSKSALSIPITDHIETDTTLIVTVSDLKIDYGIESKTFSKGDWFNNITVNHQIGFTPDGTTRNDSLNISFTTTHITNPHNENSAGDQLNVLFELFALDFIGVGTHILGSSDFGYHDSHMNILLATINFSAKGDGTFNDYFLEVTAKHISAPATIFLLLPLLAVLAIKRSAYIKPTNCCQYKTDG